MILFPDEGRGFEAWCAKIEAIAHEVGFSYRVSRFTELHAMSQGDDFVDCVEGETAKMEGAAKVASACDDDYDWYSFNDEECPF